MITHYLTEFLKTNDFFACVRAGFFPEFCNFIGSEDAECPKDFRHPKISTLASKLT